MRIISPGFKITISCFFFTCLQQLPAFAQQKSKLITDTVFLKYTDKNIQGFNASKIYYLIASDAAMVSRQQITRKLDEQHAIIQINNQATFDSLNVLLRIAPAGNNWKLSPGAEKILASTGNDNHEFIITAKSLPDFERLKTRLNRFSIIATDKLSHSYIIRCKKMALSEVLMPLDEIIFVDEKITPREEINIIGYDRSFHGINAVDYLLNGANGKNIIAGVKEQKMDETDIDLYKRVLPSPIAANTTSYHATVISTIIGGAGNSFYSGRGIANACRFFPSTFDNLFADDTAILRTNKVSVQNHSYGTVIQQFYGAEALSYDALCWANKTIVPVYSAGNQGKEKADEGPYANLAGFANLTGNFKMAKNVITVGAIDNKGNLPPESSSGPLYDGRIAPQLIALGPNGTSDAAAVVSGTIAVMQQVYADSNQNNLPPASLTKAVLYNNAEDIYNKGIDYKTGYGLLDSYASVVAILQRKYEEGNVGQGEEWSKIITVPSNTAELKVTLAWTDTVASLNNNKAIVKDLDLELKQLTTGNIIRPWILNPAPNPDSLIQLPVRNRDSLNTAEQVSIVLPTAGNYEIKVKGTATGTTPVTFHIAYKTDTLHVFSFLNPLHASDVNRNENEIITIKWKTFVADTNETGNLFISYNKGVTWDLISPAQKLYTNHYRWQIKDTNAVALLKMETGFGNFLSAPFIISEITRPSVDFNCNDSFRLSWNQHFDAKEYKIFTLTDSPYLKHILTIKDTFFVFKKTLYPSNIYAVEPVLNSGIPAARSIAQNITLQGVECFYKTFYYNLLEKNKLDLILELTAAGYSDSVYFERVSKSGQLLEVFGSIKVNGVQTVYRQEVNTQTPGTVYLRARIKLKNGAIVYTEIISVITTGTKYLLFYPNPSTNKLPLNFAIQQAIPSDSRLQIYDMSGRLIRDYESLPVTIDTRALATGIYIYKLISTINLTLETGKIIIQ
jgi:hypothetical protein